MKTKFSKKLLALFLAVLMALSTFTGALTAFAANAENDYHDANAMATNALGWVELTDEQTCEALLDYVDDVLGNVNLPVNVYMDYTVIVIDIHGYIDSVSGIIDIASQAQDLLDNNRTLINMNGGDLKNIDLSAFARLSYNSNANESQCGRSYREVNTAKDIVKALFSAIYRNTANWNGNKAIVRQFLRGSLDLGIVGNYLNIWNLLNDGIFKNLWNGGMPSGYESNLVFNIVAKLITEMTDWFTETEKANIYNQVEGYDLDTMLFKALQNSLLRKINVNVTYPDRTQSVDRYKEGNTDPHLFYTTDGNVYIFMYDENLDGLDDANLTITPTTNLFTFSLQALKIAWRTVLQPTLGQLNSAVKDYDWDYKIYATEQFGWDYDDIASNYTAAKVQAWAASASIDLDAVKSALSYNRDLVEDPQYNWRDIDSTRLFNMLRRSPLMVYYFNEVTGPLNTNFACTGTPNMDAFMDDLISNNTYTSILAGLNDCLIAAVKDFLPEYADVTSLTPCNTTDAATIATTLVGNASKVVQYIADATDKNILSGFYHTYGDAAVLSEANFEEAMLPFLIACLENNLEDLLGFIHKDKWDACKDAEGVAVVALEEYLSFSLPDRDYSSLITKDENGYYNVTLESAILPMVRDAVGYVMMQYVPVNDGAGNAWSVYDADVQTYAEQQASGTDIFTLLNSVVCYYATTKGVAPLLGLCTTSGVSTITTSNTIWQNFDLIVNKLFPIFGELQYGVAGSAFNSYDLIWNDLVSGILNIADIHTASNGGGITNFVYRLATIIGSNPISTKGIDLLAYDFVKDLLNALFNARYTNQTFYGTPVIPNATSNHPFHDAIQRDVIAGDGKNDTSLGIIGMAIVNFIEFAGYGSYPETVWDGAMFIVQALASLIPGFCPQLGNYTVGDADLSIKDSTLVNYNAGSTINNTLTVANSGVGVNRFVLNEDRATQTQLKRSYIQVTDITADKGTFTFGGYNTRIAPESDLDISVTGSISGDEFANNAAIVTFTVKYKIVDSEGNNFVDSVDTGDTTYNQEYSKEVYFYVSTSKDWYTLTYSGSTTSGFTTDLDAANSQNNAQIGAYSSMTQYLWSQGTTIFANKKAALQYPNEVIVRTSELSNINYHVFLDINYDVKKSIDGIIASSADFGGTDYFAVTCDKVTGDLTNVFYYDYYQYAYTERTVTDADGTGYTVRDIVYDENGNPTGGHWVTNDPLSRDAVLDLVNSDETVVDYRFHVVVPHDQITTTGLPIDNGGHFVPASIIEDKNADGTYNCIYLKKDSDNYKQCFEYSKTTASDVTLSSGIQGIVLSPGRFGWR